MTMPSAVRFGETATTAMAPGEPGKVRRVQVTPPLLVRYTPVVGLAANAVLSVAKAGEKAMEATPTLFRLERVQMFPASVEMYKPGVGGAVVLVQ